MATVNPGGAPRPEETWDADHPPRSTRGPLAWWNQHFLLVIGLLIAPTVLATICNGLGWLNGIPVIMIGASIFYLWIIPQVLGATSLIDLIRQLREKPTRLPDGQVVDRWATTRTAFKYSVYLFFGSLMAPVVLLGLPLKGFGGVALLIVALVVPAIVWTIQYSERVWVIKTFGSLLILVFWGALIYWAANALFPDATQSARILVHNQVIGPIRYWTTRTTTASVPEQMERKIIEQVIQNNTVKVAACLDALDKKAYNGREVTKEEIAACKALDTNPWKKTATEELAKKAAGSDTQASTPAPVLLRNEWDGIYTPSAQIQPVFIGYFKRGCYRLYGNRSEARQQITNNNGEKRFYDMNHLGEFTGYGYSVINYVTKPGEDPIAFQGKPFAYGAVFVRVNDVPKWTADGSPICVQDGAKLALDVNLEENTVNRAGSGGHRLRVERI